MLKRLFTKNEHAGNEKDDGDEGKSLLPRLLVFAAILVIGYLALFGPSRQAGVTPPKTPEAQEVESEEKYVRIKAGLMKCPAPSSTDPCFGEITQAEEEAAERVNEAGEKFVLVIREFPEDGVVEVEIPDCDDGCSPGLACIQALDYEFRPTVTVTITPTVTIEEVSTPTPKEVVALKDRVSPRTLWWLGVFILVAIVVRLLISFKNSESLITVEEGFRVPVTTFGSFSKLLEPGKPHPLVPVIQKARPPVDIRIQTVEFDDIALTTRDGVVITLDAYVNAWVADVKTAVFDAKLDTSNLAPAMRPQLKTAIATLVRATDMDDILALSGEVLQEDDRRLFQLQRSLEAVGLRLFDMGVSQVLPSEDARGWIEEQFQEKTLGEARVVRAQSIMEAGELEAKGAAAVITAIVEQLKQMGVVEVTVSDVIQMLDKMAFFAAAQSTTADKVIITGGSRDETTTMAALLATLQERPRPGAVAQEVLAALREEGLIVQRDGTIEEEGD